MKKARSDSWDLLAGLRFALAMIVVAGHLSSWHAASLWVDRAAYFCAYTSVLCFLVLSGYSIAHSAARRTEGFYTRRLLRIYPLYVIALMAGAIAMKIAGQYDAYTPHLLASNLLFQQGFRYHALSGNGVVWSLGVEVVFYGLAPFLARLRTPALLGLLAVSAAAFVAYPHFGSEYYAGLRHGLPVLLLGWAWLAGFIYYRYRGQLRAALLLVGGMFALTSLNHAFAYRLHEVTVVGSMLVLIASSRVQIPSALVRKALAYLGDLSYPLYLFHGPILLIVVTRLHVHAPAPLIGLFMVTSVVMLVVDHLLKRPAARVAEVANAARRSAVAATLAEARAFGQFARSGIAVPLARRATRRVVTAGLVGTALAGTVLLAKPMVATMAPSFAVAAGR